MNARITGFHDALAQGMIGRRDFLDRLVRITGGLPAASAFLPLWLDDYGRPQIIPPDDARLTISTAEWEVGGVTMGGYLARLKGGQKRPGVVVIHENRGLNAHIKDVTRRLALEGFLSLGIDILAPQGGTPEDENRFREQFGALDPATTLRHIASAVPFLAGHPESTGRVGAVGFCWGGGYANELAAAGTSLAANVPYYGRQLPAEQVPKITAALCLHYGELDQRINAGIAAYEAALKANNKIYELYIYEGANHAFNNDTNPSRYHKAAAELAWSRTIAFMSKHLIL
jgi:carboxymethylenebutenolidase